MDDFPDMKKASGKAYETLAAWIGGQCLPHAILIEGSDKELNTSFAMYSAKAAMCGGDESAGETPQEEGNQANRVIKKPCGMCRDCLKMEKGVHPDLFVYEGEGRARSFHIEAVRDIRSKAFIYPNEAKVKVFVLKNAQDMTEQAQNALLKILEEPPGTVVFILTCKNKSSLLETVLSRVSSVYIGGKGNEPEALPDNNNSAAADRSAAACEALRLLLGSGELEALSLLSRYERDRSGFLEILSLMRLRLEDMLIPRRAGDNAGDTSHGLHALRLIGVLDIINDISFAAEGNVNITLLQAVLCSKIKSWLSKD